MIQSISELTYTTRVHDPASDPCRVDSTTPLESEVCRTVPILPKSRFLFNARLYEAEA